MKIEFKLDAPMTYIQKATARIIGGSQNTKPYVAIDIIRRGSVNWKDTSVFIQDKDLERFAVNILKALKSKRLKK